ncbi:MAG: immune inhibitor A [Anaerolineae bacterium]|nr:immune inhibitor A [Anaerolineae bacterium]
MSRPTIVIVAVIGVLLACVVCLVPVAVWYGFPAVRTAILGAPTPRPSATTAPTVAPPTPPTRAPATQSPASATATPRAIPTTAPTANATSAPVSPPSAVPTAVPSGSPTGQAARPAGSATPEPDIVQRLQAEPPSRDLYQLTEQLKKVPGPIPRTLNRVPEPYKIGDRKTFWVGEQSKNRYYETVATLRYSTDVVYMWVEDGVTISDDAIRRSADIFTQKIYPTVRRIFGEEPSPGIDADRHLHILNGKIPDVGGYFSSADTYPTAINPYSNQAEMFYVNVDSYPVGTAGYEGTIAHEFQHMVHHNYDPSETSWINEGLSELAARLTGYGGSRFAQGFTAQPNIQLTTWPDYEQSGPHYGAGYLFASYTYDRFGEKFIHDLVAEKAHGVQGYENVLKKDSPGLTFEDVFKDWVIANYLDDSKTDTGRYGYPDIDIRIRTKLALESKGQSHEGDISQYGTEYIRLTGGSPMTLQFEGATTVQLIPTAAREGQYFMWSNRGDVMTTSLTREFDLTRLQKATLQFSTWYNIEKDYDYAYVEVSTDGGKTWDTLKTTTSTDSNPVGASYGWAFTGDSVQEDTPQWSEETGDLTPYAGKKVLVRFQMITDDAVSHNNLALDNVRIPELNYQEGFERGDGGWKSEGWVRTNTLLPQRYLLQLIEVRQDGPRVRQIPVGPDGKARVEVAGLGRDYSEAVLVVSGAASVTTQKSKYSVRVE